MSDEIKLDKDAEEKLNSVEATAGLEKSIKKQGLGKEVAPENSSSGDSRAVENNKSVAAEVLENQLLEAILPSAVDTDFAKHIDFELVKKRAAELFYEQASLGEDKHETLGTAELIQAKANNFMDSIANLRAISHVIELMDAERYRFKRKEELALLNTLKDQCTLQAKLGAQNLEIISDKMEDIQQTGIDSIEQIEELTILQGMLDNSITSTQRSVNTVSTLIKTERDSGDRPYGARKTSERSIAFIRGLEDHDRAVSNDDLKTNPARKLTVEDIKKLGHKADFDIE